MRARPPERFAGRRAERKGGSAAAEGRDGGGTRRRSANRDVVRGDSDSSRPITKRERQPRPARRGAARRAGHGLRAANHSVSGGGLAAQTPMEAFSANREGARELTVQRQPIGSRRCLGPAPPRVGLAPPPRLSRSPRGRSGQPRAGEPGPYKAAGPRALVLFLFLPLLPPAAMLRLLLLLLPLLGAAGSLPAPLRRRRSASLSVGPYLTRYLSQQVGAGCGGREFPWGIRGHFLLS